jgi:uncharacterized protein involved in exopolysaccharide biosynthesis
MPSKGLIPARANPPGSLRYAHARSVDDTPAGDTPGVAPPPPSQRANRRRLLVFLGVFLVSGAASLAYNYSRAPEYRAAARVQINPGAVQVESLKPLGGSQGADAQRPLLTELQVLTSRPVVEAAAQRLSAAMGNRVSALGTDPVTAMQSSLKAASAGETDVVELSATGGDPELTAALVNAVIGTYKEKLEQTHGETSVESLERINEELAKVQTRVAEKRRAAETFRQRHGVVSLEREENQLLARTRGQATALNNANEKLATAEGRLRSLEEAAAQGRSVVRSRDNPTLANMEQRASQIREDLRELERSFTSSYLDRDNKVVSQRNRLAELERQIEAERKRSQETAIAEAQEEVTTAREAVNRIQQQIANDRAAVQAFSARFNEYKVLQEELAQLDSLQRDTVQRKVRLEAGERARRPSVRILEAATVPQTPWRPDYGRDALLGVVGSLLLALFITWLVELFNRTDPQPAVVIAQPIPYPMVVGAGGLVPATRDALAAQMPPALAAAAPGLLTAAPSAPAFPRELVPDEVRALISASAGRTRVAAMLLLCGLGVDEIASLGPDDLDRRSRVVNVGGATPRSVELPEPVWTALDLLPSRPGVPLLADESGSAPGAEDLALEIFYAAHDGGIARPSEVTPDALRHSYLAFLVRQGIRFGDLVRIVGRLSPDRAAAYGDLAPTGERVSLDKVDRTMPGLELA